MGGGQNLGPQVSSPCLEPADGALENTVVVGERGELLLEQRLGSTNATAHRAFGDPQHLAKLLRRHLFPVVQLEHDLVLDRDPSQRLKRQCLLFALRDEHGGIEPQIVHRGHPQIESFAVPPSLA